MVAVRVERERWTTHGEPAGPSPAGQPSPPLQGSDSDPVLRARLGQTTVTDAEITRLGLGFEPKAQQLLPVRDVPADASSLGRWWGRFKASPCVKGALLGASGLVVALGAQIAKITPAAAQSASKREVVYLGMNPGAKHEAGKLRRWAPEGVALISPSKVQDRVLVDGRLVDLASAAGRAAFVDSLQLAPEASSRLNKLLEQTEDWAKDEIAKLSRLFAEAERGERVIERLVLSGHSLGTGLWGDDNGEISWRNLSDLARTFPKAARQVQDVMVAACYAGGRTHAKQFRAIFPRVQSLWGYAGSAPGAYSGAVWHLKRWEKQTRGPGDARVNRDAVARLRKGKNVAVWTQTRGYDDGQPKAAMSKLHADYARSRDLVPLYLSGSREVGDPGRGPLREHYGNLQRLLQRPELPAAEREALSIERQMVIRLIYFGRIRGYFAEANRDTLVAAHRDLGLQLPAYERLSRRDALAAIATYERALSQIEAPSEAAQRARDLLVDGLRDLRPERIPSAWL